MDTLNKLKKLGEAAQYDVCGYSQKNTPSVERFIYPAKVTSGKAIPLLKVLLTNACENDCFYCANRCSLSFPRYTFEPEELTKLFIQLKDKGKVSGLFLSSAICGNTKVTMEKMIKSVEILRMKHKFSGYIHLKVLPQAPLDYVRRAIQLADRVSINLEAPNRERLKRISSDKDFDELLLRIKWISDIADKSSLPAGHTTQFVVGAADETDKEILETTFRLHREFNLKRAYFSAFRPVARTPLGGHPKTPKEREHRLYQTDFLFQEYNFSIDEIPFSENGNLPEGLDPKLASALAHPERFPVEINKADFQELIRVPGIGPKSAQKLLSHRIRNKIYSLEELKGIGLSVKRAVSFILIDGKLPKPLQLELWNEVTK